MATYRCPMCQENTEITPTSGYEIVSVYCLKHRAALGGVNPVRMEPASAGGAADRKLELVGAASL